MHRGRHRPSTPARIALPTLLLTVALTGLAPSAVEAGPTASDVPEPPVEKAPRVTTSAAHIDPAPNPTIVLRGKRVAVPHPDDFSRMPLVTPPPASTAVAPRHVDPAPSGVTTAAVAVPRSIFFHGEDVLRAHEVVVVPYRWADEPQAQDDAQVAAIREAIDVDADRYWSAATGGAVSFTVTEVTDWVVLPRPAGDACMPTDALLAAAEQRSGVDGTDLTRHLVLYTPSQDCGYSTGLAWGVPGSFVQLRGAPLPSGPIHELGHDLGLWHANSLSAGDSDAGPWRPHGGDVPAVTRHQEYGDPYDVMGIGAHGPSGFALRTLGVLDAAAAPTLAASATVHLAPLHSTEPPASGQVRSVSVPAGPDEFILDYRADLPGLDQGLSAVPGAGVTVTLASAQGYVRQGARLLARTVRPDDGLPVAPAAFGAGTSWTSPDHQVTVTVLSADDAGAVVHVERVPDTTPPPAPESFGSWWEGAALWFGWSPMDDAATGVAWFDLTLDGVPVARIDRSRLSGRFPAVPPDGLHTLGVTATDRAGNSVSRTTTQLFDAHAPQVTLGAIVPTGGTMGTDGALPAKVRWTASDPVTDVCDQTLLDPRRKRSTALGRWTREASPSLLPGAHSLSLRVRDCYDNAVTVTGTRTSTSTGTLRGVRASGFSRASASSAVGRDLLVATRAGATATWTCTGRWCAIAARRGPGQGRATVRVDGRPVATLDLRAARDTDRGIVWLHDVRTAGKHQVTVTALGTRGRPRVTLDEVVSIR